MILSPKTKMTLGWVFGFLSLGSILMVKFSHFGALFLPPALIFAVLSILYFLGAHGRSTR